MRDSELINTTRVYCTLCTCFHEARVVRAGNRIEGVVECPEEVRTVVLSSDADMFLAIRSRYYGPLTRPLHYQGGHLVNLINITNHCNMRCPVCYAGSGPEEDPGFLPVEEIVRRAVEARRRGAKVVTLSGGEPTLHPALPEAVRLVRRKGLRVVVPTNGIVLGEDPGLVGRLRNAGLWKVNMQFDTLDPEVHLSMRGTDAVKAKEKAMRTILASGMALGTITTVTALNLPEVGRLVRFGLSLGPGLTSMIFQAATAAGRYRLGEASLVDREQIIRALLDSHAVPGATMDHVWPLPFFAPWAMGVHPDCAVNLFLAVENDRVELVGDYVDFERLYTQLKNSRAGRSWWARNVLPLRCLLGACQGGGRLRLLRQVLNYAGAGGRRGLMIIGIGSYVLESFWDRERVAQCGSAVLTGSGPVSPCIWYSGAKNLLHN